MYREYKCLNPDCDWQWRERNNGRLFIPEELMIKFENTEGKTVRKCPYCRGKVEEVRC